MARRVIWGTPFRSVHYLFPRGKWKFLVPSLLAGTFLLLVLLALHAFGFRRPVAPGAVTSGHAGFESRCEECHQPRHGSSNLRCQRCHDPSGAGRLTQPAHAFFGSGDLKKAGEQQSLECAQCHVEHRGRGTPLAAVDQAQCVSCHFRKFSGHPEFAVLKTKSQEVPGILFTHDRHVKEVLKETGGSEKDTCITCHQPEAEAAPGRRSPDIEPIVFDKHCASCHVKDDSVGSMDPVTMEDVLGPADLEAQGLGSFDPDEFEISRGKIQKTVLMHQDEWVLQNLRKLRREVDPEGWGAERGALLARQNQLERRMAQAAPLAGQDLEGLRARLAGVDSEIKGIENRLAAQRDAQGPDAGLTRVEDVAAAAAEAGQPSESDALKSRLEPLRAGSLQPAALPEGDLDARRQELLSALDAVETTDPQLKSRADDLRRRLAALRPGDTGAEVLKRALDQRQADRTRVSDEISLRESGIEPPAVALLAAEQRVIRDALRRVRARLDELSVGPAPKTGLAPEQLARKKESTEVLVAACAKCHVFKSAAFTRVVPASRVLVRSTFAHGPHLKRADCTRCHAGIEKSKLSSDITFTGVASCQECHAPRETREDCVLCHQYHPPVSP